MQAASKRLPAKVMIAAVVVLVLVVVCFFFFREKQDTVPPAGGYSQGQIADGVYTSEYYGIRFVPPTGMTFADRDAALQELNMTSLQGELVVQDEAGNFPLVMASGRMPLPTTTEESVSLMKRELAAANVQWIDGGKSVPVELAGLTFQRIGYQIHVSADASNSRQPVNPHVQVDYYIYAKDYHVLEIIHSYIIQADGSTSAAVQQANQALLAGFTTLRQQDSPPGDSTQSLPKSQSQPQPTVDYSVGVLAETSYASDYYGLHYTLPSGCAMMSREELDAMMEAGMGGTDGVEAQSTTYGELLAVHDATGSNILLLTEKLEMPVDCQGYANLANRRYEGQEGITLVNDGKVTPAELGGLPFQKVGYIFDFGEDGGKAYSDSYLYKLGDYMLVLTTYRQEGDESQKALDTLLAGFEL